jgi:hypothetical protein
MSQYSDPAENNEILVYNFNNEILFKQFPMKFDYTNTKNPKKWRRLDKINMLNCDFYKVATINRFWKKTNILLDKLELPKNIINEIVDFVTKNHIYRINDCHQIIAGTWIICKSHNYPLSLKYLIQIAKEKIYSGKEVPIYFSTLMNIIETFQKKKKPTSIKDLINPLRIMIFNLYQEIRNNKYFLSKIKDRDISEYIKESISMANKFMDIAISKKFITNQLLSISIVYYTERFRSKIEKRPNYCVLDEIAKISNRNDCSIKDFFLKLSSKLIEVRINHEDIERCIIPKDVKVIG